MSLDIDSEEVNYYMGGQSLGIESGKSCSQIKQWLISENADNINHKQDSMGRKLMDIKVVKATWSLKSDWFIHI